MADPIDPLKPESTQPGSSSQKDPQSQNDQPPKGAQPAQGGEPRKDHQPGEHSSGEANHHKSPGLKKSAEFRAWFLLIVIMGGIIWALWKDFPIISRLSDAGFARGLITFLISVATIGLAFTLITQASSATSEGFRRAREIFTGLMGVLGTIVGFYFGSADKSSATMTLAEISFANKQLITHVSGGTRPYRYSVTSDDKDFVSIKNKVSDDGWIMESPSKALKAGSIITIEVTDNKDQKASQKIELPGDPKATPNPAAQKPDTAGSQPIATPTATTSPPSPTGTGSPAR